MTCPLCRKKTDLPPGGVRRLPDNFVVPRLVDIVCGPSKQRHVMHGTTDGPTRVISAQFRFLFVSVTKTILRYEEKDHDDDDDNDDDDKNSHDLKCQQHGE